MNSDFAAYYDPAVQHAINANLALGPTKPKAPNPHRYVNHCYKKPLETQRTSTASASIPAKAPAWAAAMRRIYKLPGE
jgi:hypothetical protein